ncbi:MAG: hypothetical protein QOJ29_3271 [Thermoleophilaceae bacterium]|jgi:hypothetical protein|nr:hypothetical protein [Thermoleophilaceae bacterium]
MSHASIACATSAMKPGLMSWIGETLIAIVSASALGLSRFQSLARRMASLSTHRPSGTISPVSSASGMKLSGARPALGVVPAHQRFEPVGKPLARKLLGRMSIRRHGFHEIRHLLDRAIEWAAFERHAMLCQEENSSLLTDTSAQKKPQGSGPRSCRRVDAERVGQSVELAFDDVERLSAYRNVSGDPRPDNRFKRLVGLASAGPGVPLILEQRARCEWWVKLVRRHPLMMARRRKIA